MGKVLITGAYGFLGTYVRNGFGRAGWEIVTLGRSDKHDIPLDLSKEEPELEGMGITRVVHCAGLTHATAVDKEGAQKFYDHNLEATENLLISLIPIVDQIDQFVFMSSTAVYGKAVGYHVPEDVSLDGNSPFAQSKIHAEEQVSNWEKQYGTPSLILRLPPVAGINAPQRIPEMIKGLESGGYVRIGSGSTRKSMVLAEDIADHLPKWSGKSGIFNLTDGQHPSFYELEQYLIQKLQLPQARVLPDWRARILAGIGDLIPGFKMHSRLYQQITSEMTFDDSKARKILGWTSRTVIEHDWL